MAMMPSMKLQISASSCQQSSASSLQTDLFSYLFTLHLCIYLFLVFFWVCRFYSNRDQTQVSGEQFDICDGFVHWMTLIGIGTALLIAIC